MLLGSLQVEIDIALRIDHDRFALGGQHVRRVSHAAQVKLLEIHIALLRFSLSLSFTRQWHQATSLVSMLRPATPAAAGRGSPASRTAESRAVFNVSSKAADSP